MKQHCGGTVSMLGALLVACGAHDSGVGTESAGGSTFQELLPHIRREYEGFGSWVSLSGDSVLVSAFSGYEGTDTRAPPEGSVYVFTRQGPSWVEEVRLLPDDDGSTIGVDGLFWDDGFGFSAVLSDQTALVGTRRKGVVSRVGAAYVFARSGSSWSEQQKLLPADGAEDDFFGSALAMSGDTVVVGAGGDDDNGSNSGSVYVFTRSDSSWVEQQKLLPTDGAQDDRFGSSLALAGDTLAVGAPDDDNGNASGSVYVFARSGSKWSEQQKLLPADGAHRFGSALSMSGDLLAVGAAGDDGSGSGSGAAYLFVCSGSTWGEQQKLLVADGARGDWFGGSLSLDGDTLAVGAKGDDDNGSDSGAAYVFDGPFL